MKRKLFDAIAAGNSIATQSVNNLAEIRSIGEHQVTATAAMAAEIADLRQTVASLVRELSMIRNSLAAQHAIAGAAGGRLIDS